MALSHLRSKNNCVSWLTRSLQRMVCYAEEANKETWIKAEWRTLFYSNL